MMTPYKSAKDHVSRVQHCSFRKAQQRVVCYSSLQLSIFRCTLCLNFLQLRVCAMLNSGNANGTAAWTQSILDDSCIQLICALRCRRP